MGYRTQYCTTKNLYGGGVTVANGFSTQRCLSLPRGTRGATVWGLLYFPLKRLGHSGNWSCASLKHGPKRFLTTQRKQERRGGGYRETKPRKSVRLQTNSVVTRRSGSDWPTNLDFEVTLLPYEDCSSNTSKRQYAEDPTHQ